MGRDHDLAAIETLIANANANANANATQGARLITLLGPGGVGKTRLLYRVVEHLSRSVLPSTSKPSKPKSNKGKGPSVVSCDLSSAHSTGDVLTRVAAAMSGAALGAGTTTNEAAIERVGRALARRGACILALDNLEQLDTSSLPMLARWLGQAPALTIITTSRVRLAVAGEVVHRVAPLPAMEAMRLFDDRAAAVRAPFGKDERIAAERIVALLEGMPLALEMAATKLCILRPEELLERLSRPLAVLDGTPTDPERHASLSRVLDGSWELLDDEERRVLSELGVFSGGFTIESAEAIVSSANVLAILQRLVDSSLLHAMPSSRSQRARHAPYVVVREYALERLVESGRLDDVKRAHARHFAAWGEARLSHMGARDDASLHELVDDEANLAAAAAFLRGFPSQPPEGLGTRRGFPSQPAEDDPDELRLRVLSALEPVRMLGGQLDPWVSDLEDAFASKTTTHAARARLALARGLHELGRARAAREAYQIAIADAALAKAAALESFALSQLGRLSAGFGEWEQAGALFEKARKLPGAGEAAAKLANACFEFYGAESGVSTDIVGAVGAYVDVCRRSGSDPRELVFWLVQLGRSESELYRSAEDAMVHLDEALALARRLGDIRGEGFALFGIGSHDLGWGRPDEAIPTLDAAAKLLREAGTRRFEGWALGFLGVAHAMRDRWDAALEAFDPAIAILCEVRDAPREAHVLAYRAAVKARTDHEERASADLARASMLAPESSKYHAWTIELCRAQLDVLRARRRDASPKEREEHLDVARALLRRAGWPAQQKTHEWPWNGEFYEPRLAAELLDRAIKNAEAAPTGMLVVAQDGSSFVLPSGERVACAGREKLQRLLIMLVKERIAHPGQPVTPAALIECAWGDERMQSSAASNRLHVALDALRKLGLRALLLRAEATLGGWFLDPAVPCSWAAGASAASAASER